MIGVFWRVSLKAILDDYGGVVDMIDFLIVRRL